MDKIILRGLECRAKIGVTQAERDVGQHLQFDIDLYLALTAAGQSDRLEDTVSYASVADTIVALARRTEYRLMERLADEVARELLAGFPVEAVRVRVAKVPPPVDVTVRLAGVEIERRAPEASRTKTQPTDDG